MGPAIENTDQTENRYQKTHACIESESKVSEYKRARVCLSALMGANREPCVIMCLPIFVYLLSP